MNYSNEQTSLQETSWILDKLRKRRTCGWLVKAESMGNDWGIIIRVQYHPNRKALTVDSHALQQQQQQQRSRAQPCFLFLLKPSPAVPCPHDIGSKWHYHSRRSLGPCTALCPWMPWPSAEDIAAPGELGLAFKFHQLEHHGIGDHVYPCVVGRKKWVNGLDDAPESTSMAKGLMPFKL